MNSDQLDLIEKRQISESDPLLGVTQSENSATQSKWYICKIVSTIIIFIFIMGILLYFSLASPIDISKDKKKISVSILLVFISFAAASLSIGYGTAMASVLLILGFNPIDITASILFSESFSSVIASILHYLAGNLQMDRQSIHVMLTLSLCAIIGVIISQVVRFNISQFALSLYIGIMILCLGFFILFTKWKAGQLPDCCPSGYLFPNHCNEKGITIDTEQNDEEYGWGQKFATQSSFFQALQIFFCQELLGIEFCWWKLILFGLIAAFNKGLSGGGFGPIICGGQIVSGLNERTAMAITSTAEMTVSISGTIAYVITNGWMDWYLAIPLTIGSILSVPISVYATKHLKTQVLSLLIGLISIYFGTLYIVKVTTHSPYN